MSNPTLQEFFNKPNIKDDSIFLNLDGGIEIKDLLIKIVEMDLQIKERYAYKLIEDAFITYNFRGLSKDKEEPTTYEILKIAYEIYKEDCQVVTTAKKLKEMGISK